jgi:hypothetical protein
MLRSPRTGVRPRVHRILLRLAAVVAVVLLLAFAFVRLARTPSNEREWNAAQRVLPRVEVRGELVEIRNVRDFTWRSESEFDARYLDRTFDLRELDSVWYAISRFGGVPGLAHAFLTFGFGDEYVSISVEARKEAHETYSPYRGLLREYELMYVIGTERDVLGLRTNVWKEDLTLYPIRTTPEQIRRTFVDMTMRAEKLAVDPEFYDTFTSSCSSNIIRHVNTIAPGQIRAGIGTILPGFSDRVAWKLGMIDSDLPLERIRDVYRVGAAAQSVPLDDEFSRAIRRNLPSP